MVQSARTKKGVIIRIVQRTKGDAVLIFVRFPRPGKVKTRLAQSLGNVRAAGFYRLCAESSLQQIGMLPDDVQKYIYCTGENGDLEHSFWTRPPFQLVIQAGETLGQRLQNAFSDMFINGALKVVIVASDVPDLTVDILNRALKALDTHDITIGPCPDGWLLPHWNEKVI